MLKKNTVHGHDVHTSYQIHYTTLHSITLHCTAFLSPLFLLLFISCVSPPPPPPPAPQVDLR